MFAKRLRLPLYGMLLTFAAGVAGAAAQDATCTLTVYNKAYNAF
jgi:hypothetical protein